MKYKQLQETYNKGTLGGLTLLLELAVIEESAAERAFNIIYKAQC